MRKKLAIIGYSGHSYVCINAALLCGIEIIGYFDFKKKLNPYDLKFLGSENNTDYIGQMFISVGDNKVRKSIYTKLNNTKLLSTSIIHPNSTISSDFNIKKTVKIKVTKTSKMNIDLSLTLRPYMA